MDAKSFDSSDVATIFILSMPASLKQSRRQNQHKFHEILTVRWAASASMSMCLANPFLETKPSPLRLPI